MADLEKNLHQVLERIQKTAHLCGRNESEIDLVVVTKEQPAHLIQKLYDLGVRDFGENRLHEALIKQQQLPDDIRWHFIGTLQTSKIGKAVQHFDLIHSVDSFELAQKIDRTQVLSQVLIQVNTSREISKHGFLEEDFCARAKAMKMLSHISVKGLMTIGPLHGREADVRDCFRALRTLRDEYLPGTILSMGMSQDYEIAIEEGATLLRIGSAIFK